MVAAKTEVATPGSVAGTQPGPASRTVPSNAEPLSHTNRGVFGTDVDTHKTADRVRLHHGSKYASRDRSARTGARTHMLQAHPLYLQAYQRTQPPGPFGFLRGIDRRFLEVSAAAPNVVNSVGGSSI